jgi:hypothetical protein
MWLKRPLSIVICADELSVPDTIEKIKLAEAAEALWLRKSVNPSVSSL